MGYEIFTYFGKSYNGFYLPILQEGDLKFVKL